MRHKKTPLYHYLSWIYKIYVKPKKKKKDKSNAINKIMNHENPLENSDMQKILKTKSDIELNTTRSKYYLKVQSKLWCTYLRDNNPAMRKTKDINRAI